jgi:hypothetical protein
MGMAPAATDIGVFDLNLMFNADRIYPDAPHQSKPLSDYLCLQCHVGTGIGPQYAGNGTTFA